MKKSDEVNDPRSCLSRTEQERLDLEDVAERQRHLDRLADERDQADRHYQGALARADQAKQDLRRAKEAREFARAKWESAFGTGKWARKLPPADLEPARAPAASERPLEECEQAELFPEADKELPPLPALVEQYRAIAEEHEGHVVLLRSPNEPEPAYTAYDKSAEVLSGQRQPWYGSKPALWTPWGIPIETVYAEDLGDVIDRALDCGWPVVVGEPDHGAWDLKIHVRTIAEEKGPTEPEPPPTEKPAKKSRKKKQIEATPAEKVAREIRQKIEEPKRKHRPKVKESE